MQAAKKNQRMSNLPPRKAPGGRNPNMNKLYNRVVDFIEQEGVKFATDSDGDRFVDSLHKTLWYIDGHHTTIGGSSTNRACKIPYVFTQFQG